MTDPETQQQLSEADHLKSMVESTGWRIAYGKLTDRILDLQNISNVDVSTPEAAVLDLKARKMAADILFSWAKQDIYGYIEQQQATLDEKLEQPDHIDRR